MPPHPFMHAVVTLLLVGAIFCIGILPIFVEIWMFFRDIFRRLR